MKIIDKIKNLLRRRPLTEDELRARAELEAIRAQARENEDRASGGRLG
jgi:hypothetical protein